MVGIAGFSPTCIDAQPLKLTRVASELPEELSPRGEFELDVVGVSGSA
jgi:hypothetical protein